MRVKIAYVLATAILGFGCCAPSFAQGGSSTLAATAAASSSANVNSPSLNLTSNYYNGSSSQPDVYSIIDVLGTGSNPSSALQITHTGTGGAGVVQAPMFQATGSGAGGFIFTGGSAPTLPTVASTITIYAPMTTFTTYGLVLPNAGATGIPHWSFTSPTVIESVSAITGSDCPTCVTSSSSLTSGNVVVGAGSQAASTTSTLQVGAGTPDVTVNQINSGDTMLLLKEVSGSSGGNMLDLQTNGGTRQFSVSQAGTVSNYNGLTTAGAGVTSVAAVLSVLGTSGNSNLGTQTLFTTGTVTNALYRVSYYISQASNCGTTGSVYISFVWADPHHNRSASQASNTLTLALTNGLPNSVNGSLFINVASSTSIQWNSTTGGGTTCSTGSYDVYTSLERIQ
jgi:hypothetical protein